MPILARYILLFLATAVGGAALGAAFGYGMSNKDKLLELWYGANEQRHLVMAGEVGPVTYLVYYDDYSILENAANSDDNILGVEMYRFPDVAAIAFKDGNTESVSQVSGLPGIHRMERRNVPMFCH